MPHLKPPRNPRICAARFAPHTLCRHAVQDVVLSCSPRAKITHFWAVFAISPLCTKSSSLALRQGCGQDGKFRFSTDKRTMPMISLADISESARKRQLAGTSATEAFLMRDSGEIDDEATTTDLTPTDTYTCDGDGLSFKGDASALTKQVDDGVGMNTKENTRRFVRVSRGKSSKQAKTCHKGTKHQRSKVQPAQPNTSGLFPGGPGEARLSRGGRLPHETLGSYGRSPNSSNRHLRRRCDKVINTPADETAKTTREKSPEEAQRVKCSVQQASAKICSTNLPVRVQTDMASISLLKSISSRIRYVYFGAAISHWQIRFRERARRWRDRICCGPFLKAPHLQCRSSTL